MIDIKKIIILFLSVFFATHGVASDINELHTQNSGSDLHKLEDESLKLLELAFEHIDRVGLGQALIDFRNSPWKREANQLHIWGMTDQKVDWYDAGHQEYEGISFDGVPDLNGLMFADEVLKHVHEEKPMITHMVFPHPVTTIPSDAMVVCKFLLDDKHLCTGAFLE